MKAIIIFGIKFGGVMALLSAGSVHSFPFLWRRWEILLREEPWAHWLIGSVALLFGLLNLFLLVSELVKKFQKYPKVPNSIRSF